MRPAKFAQDDTPDLPVFVHGLKWLDKHEGCKPNVVVHLRPTSPLCPPDLVDRAVEILLKHPNADSVRGVVPGGQNPHKMWQTGHVDAIRPVTILKGSMSGENIYPLLIDSSFTIDIDTQLSLSYAA